MKQTSRRAVVSYAGPLPIASQFAALEKAVPGTGDRLVTMAEKDQDHLHELEKLALRGDQLRATLGLCFSPAR